MGRASWVVLAWGVILLLCSRTTGLSCDCTGAICPTLDDCGNRGEEMDTCRCCLVCKKAEGENCGGPFRVSGNCGFGLECVKEDYLEYDQAFGICMRSPFKLSAMPVSLYLAKLAHGGMARAGG